MSAKEKSIILFIDSSHAGGIESHVLLLAKYLKRFGFQVTVLFYKRYGEHPLHNQLVSCQINRHYLDGKLLTLFHFLQKNKPCILHTHGYKASIIGKFIGNFLRIPVFSTYHAGEPGSGLLKYYNKLDCLLSCLSKNIAVSEQIAQHIYGKKTIISNFVEPMDLKVLSLSLQQRLFFVGRLSLEKGPDLFLKLAELCPNVTFDIYGVGPEYEKLCHTGLKNVEFHGYVSSSSIPWHLADFLCMPSRHEGLPLAALEAMAHAVPVIAFPVGGLTKLIENEYNGFLTHSKDISLMADVIQYIYSSKFDRYSDMCHCAHQKIVENYSAKLLVHSIVKFYALSTNLTV